MMREVDDGVNTIPGILLDPTVPDYREAHSTLGVASRERAIAVREQVSHELYLSVIEAKWGNISAIAKELGIPRHIAEQQIRTEPELWQAYVNAREVKVDLLEDAVFDKALAGDIRAATAYLEAQAKHRGWGKESKSLNIGVNLKDLTIEELQQIVNGEVPERMK